MAPSIRYQALSLWWLHDGCTEGSFLRRGLAACGPRAKLSRPVNGNVAACLGFFVPVVHDMALTHTGSASVQIAASSHPDELETAFTTRALHIGRERVKPHGKLWHPCHSFAAVSPHAVHSPNASTPKVYMTA
jgi:hypothetical protein